MFENQKFKKILPDHRRNNIVFALLLLSAISCCLYIDSIYIELPYLVPYAPEGWDLGAFTAVLNGIGKLSLFATPLAIKFGLRNTVHVCKILGVIIGTSLIFMWDKTIATSLFSYDLSIGFIIHAGLLFGIDSLRSTVFLMHLEQDYPEPFLTAGIVGQVSSGAVTTIMSCLQGYRVAFKPTQPLQETERAISKMSLEFLFGPQVAFSVILGILFVSSLSFVFLQCLVYINEKFQTEKPAEREISEYSPLNAVSNQKYFLWGVAMFSWGSLCAYSPTFFTFTALAYNQRCYTLSVLLWGVTLPLTGLFAHFKPAERKITFVTLISTLCTIFAILTLIALESPHPPFIDSALMQACIIIMWGSESFLCYLLYASALHSLQNSGGPGAFKWGVVLSQAASTVLGLICFCIISFTNIFTDEDA